MGLRIGKRPHTGTHHRERDKSRERLIFPIRSSGLFQARESLESSYPAAETDGSGNLKPETPLKGWPTRRKVELVPLAQHARRGRQLLVILVEDLSA